MSTRHTVVSTQLGDLTLVANGEALTGVYFAHHWTRPSASTFGKRVDAADDDLFTGAATQLAEYLTGDRTAFELPIAWHGDEVQERVWRLLAEIPYGKTVTYGELAITLGDVTAKEVGQAVGRNPLSIVVPCHRVVGKDGKLTGYAGGLKRKQFLLELEEPAEEQAQRLF
jgi:methylated-DNA-[protein]-cysteine S-methyltransferase